MIALARRFYDQRLKKQNFCIIALIILEVLHFKLDIQCK